MATTDKKQSESQGHQQVELPDRQSTAVVPVTTSSEHLMGMIAQAVKDPSIDVMKMKELYAMWREMEAFRAERAFNDAMTACQEEMPRLVRDGFNPQTKSKYAKLDQAVLKITPIYTKHKFNIVFRTEKSDLQEHIKMVATVSGHGHKEQHAVEMPYDYLGPNGTPNKTKIHGVGSAFSYARRYLLYLIFNIAIVGEDTDGAGGGDQNQKGPATATIQNRTWFLNELKKRDLEKKAIQYAIDKAIIMPDKGLPDWPLNKLPIVQSAYEKLFEEIKNHK